MLHIETFNSPSLETQGQIVGVRESVNGRHFFPVIIYTFPRPHYLPLGLRGCYFAGSVRFSLVRYSVIDLVQR